MFVGINEYSEEIIELIEPEIKLDIFYYSCSNKFVTDIATKYVGLNNAYSGTIIFANGDECLAYQFVKGNFIKIFGLNGNLVKRHNKGGYSANRFARIAEESRHIYIVRICDRLRELDTQNNWIWGSEEIVQMILKQSPLKLNYGGFLEFNNSTISNQKYWLNFLNPKENYDAKYQEILNYLAINPDMLDFDPANKANMKYYMINKKDKQNKQNKSNDLEEQNKIPLEQTSKYYSQLMMFEYIGVKYFNYQEIPETYEISEMQESQIIHIIPEISEIFN